MKRRRKGLGNRRAANRAMTCVEIAAVLGITPRGVESALARGLAKMRLALGAEWMPEGRR